MHLTTWSFVLFVILAWPNIMLTTRGAAFEIESVNKSLPVASLSGNVIIVSAAVDITCFAYLNSVGSAVVFGYGSDLRLVSIAVGHLFTVAATNDPPACLLFYTSTSGPSTQIYAEDQTGGLIVGPYPFTGSPTTVYTMNIIADPRASDRLILGFSYADGGNASVEFSLVEFNYRTNQFSDIDYETQIASSTANPVIRCNFHQFGSENVSVVLQFRDSPQIWAGNMSSRGSVTFSPTDSISLTNVVGMTSRAMSAESGVLCYNSNEHFDCYQWTPGTSKINDVSFYDAFMLNGSTPALARLNSYSTALFGVDVLNTFIHEFQNGGLVGTTPLSLESTGTLKYFAVTDADSSNRLSLLIRDDGGAMQLVRIRHDINSPAPTPTPATQAPSSSPSGVIGTPNDSGPVSSPNEQGSGGPPSDASISTIVPAVVIPVVVVAAGLIILLVMLRRRKKGKGSLLHGKSRVEIAMDSIDDRLKIPYKSLVFKKEIGAGSYGKVYVGEWKGTPVAIKVSSSVSDMDGFFDEARITVGLQQHPNVVQTFGVSLDGQLPCIVLEFCEGGSLDNRLFDSDVTMTQQQKIALIKGIARGLYHLHTNNIVHRDLAARNVLLNKSGTPKISDFGMSRVLKSEAEKGKTRTNYGPIRWMAPESLRELQYSTKSDVWSFGIVLYEIVSRNEPHIDVDPLEVAVKIKNESYHPSIPQGVNSVLSEIMLSCWQADPNNRPSMEQICTKLNSAFPED
jgi:predicted Ser/Thr protein kinase